MKKNPPEQLTNDTKISINKDLLEAKKIIIVKTTSDMKKINAREMQKKIKELEDLKMPLNLEQKLLLVTLAANLGIFFFYAKKQGMKIFYLTKMQSHYMNVDKDEPLLKPYNAQWAAVIGDVYQLVENFEKAIDFYEKAIEFVKRGGDNDLSASAIATIRQYNLTLIRLNIMVAVQRVEKKANPSLVSARYSEAIMIANHVLNATQDQFTSEGYYLKSHAQSLFAIYQNGQKQSDHAIVLMTEAILMAIVGLKVTVIPYNQLKYIGHIELCHKKLLSMVKRKYGKENIPLQFQNILSMLERANFKELSNIDPLATALEKLLNPQTNANNSASFWQASVPTNQEHIKKDALSGESDFTHSSHT